MLRMHCSLPAQRLFVDMHVSYICTRHMSCFPPIRRERCLTHICMLFQCFHRHMPLLDARMLHMHTCSYRCIHLFQTYGGKEPTNGVCAASMKNRHVVISLREKCSPRRLSLVVCTVYICVCMAHVTVWALFSTSSCAINSET